VKVHLQGSKDFITSSPTLLFIPPPIVHGFQFQEAIDGGVISVDVNLFKSLFSKYSLPHDWIDEAIVVGDNKAQTDSFDQSFTRIEEEFSKPNRFRNSMLQIMLEDLIVQLTRLSLGNSQRSKFSPLSRQQERARAFCDLLETYYCKNVGLNFYAQELKISTVQLTRTCRAVLDKSPNEMIMARKILEAKRMLKFTQRSIEDVSDTLSFNTVGYFSRFFKRKTGQTPRDFRNKTKSSIK